MSNLTPVTMAYGNGLGWMKDNIMKMTDGRLQTLRTYDGAPGYTLAQGQ